VRKALLVLLLAAALPGAAPAAAVGELRMLVVRATWGPTPEDGGAVARALDEASAFYARSSSGTLRISFELTPWLHAYAGTSICPTVEDEEDEQRSALGPISRFARAAAGDAGYDASAFDRVVFVLPEHVCGLPGLGVRGEVLLAGPATIGAQAVVHELGHTFGLPHAGSAACPSCAIFEYGDRLSPMGRAFVDFSIFEKRQLGWPVRVAVVRKSGSYRVGAADTAGAAAQALVIPTRRGEYWVEHRIAPAPALVVRLVRTDRFRPYPRSVQLSGSAGSYTDPGVFSVRRVSRRGETAVLAVRVR